MSILEDVTDQRDAAEALKLGAARAEAANRAKSEFLANMSHPYYSFRSPYSDQFVEDTCF